MQTRFLLGPAGSGKTFRCLADIRAALQADAQGPPLILLAPKQATFQLERQLLGAEDVNSARQDSRPAITGYTRLQIFSFERLARFVLATLKVPPPALLAEEGRIMVLRALLLRHDKELTVFRASARRPGFATQLAQSLSELQQHQVTAAKLATLAGRQAVPPELKDKLHDLALLLEAYARWLEENELQDANRLLDFATNALRSALPAAPIGGGTAVLPLTGGASVPASRLSHSALRSPQSPLQISGLWLDGFAEMTPQELDLLATVLPFCERATLAFCVDESGARLAEAKDSWLSLWLAVGNTCQQCRQRIESLPDARIETEFLPRDSQNVRFAKDSELFKLERDWVSHPVHGPSPPHEPRSADLRVCGFTEPPGSVSPTVQGLKARFFSEKSHPGPLPSRQMEAEREQQANVNRLPEAIPAISVTVCAGPDEEAIFAAREILKFVRAGNRFRDCAVIVRDLGPYYKALASAFRRYRVPFFLDRRESVAHHPLAELTRSALRTVAGDWPHEDWFAALKAGFTPADETEIDWLENAALEFGWRGKKWREPLPDEKMERLRQKILPPFTRLAARLKDFEYAPAGPELAQTLRRLWQDVHAEETLERWSEAEGSKSAIGHRQSAIHMTVWEETNAWLDNLALAFPREPMPLREWLPVLEAGLSALTVGVIPPVLDEVLIGAIDRARNPGLKLALVLGVNESVFPAAPAATPILTEGDRGALEQCGVPLGPDLRARLARERYYGYIAFTRASERLAVAFSRHDANGKALNPSPFVAQLRRIFPAIELEEFSALADASKAEHATELIGAAVKFAGNIQYPTSNTQHPTAGASRWRELLELPALASLAESLRDCREPDPAENLSPALAERLYGALLKTSVSRLEEFAQCPFRFFVRSGLRAGERKLFELDARERGTFQHDVLKEFHTRLAARGLRWRDLTPAQAREQIRAIVAGQAAQFRGGLLRDTAQSEFEARMLGESLQDFVEVVVSWLREQNDFDPVAAELDFGGESAPAPSWQVDLGGNRKLALQGRIDRVDLWRKPGSEVAAALVMDYKSGNKKLDAVLVEHGIQLQLLAYLGVLRHWVEPGAVLGATRLDPAGVFYVNLRGQYESSGTRREALDDAASARKRAYRHTGRFDAGILPALDRLGKADQFSYKLTNDGSLHRGSTEAMPRAEFEKLLDRVEIQLREMGRAIFAGVAHVDPYRKGAATPCEYCDYRSVCRIDPWTHRYRVLKAASH